MKFEIGNYVEPVAAFFDEYKTPIVGAIFSAVVGVIAKKYGVEAYNPYRSNIISINAAKKGSIPTTTTIPTRNATETALAALYRSAINTDSSYYQYGYAKKMHDLVKTRPIDEHTQQLAIDLIGKIACRSDSSYYEHEMMSLVSKIANLETVKEVKDEESSN